MISEEFAIFIEGEFVMDWCFGQAQGIIDISPRIGFKCMIDVKPREILCHEYYNGFLKIGSF